MRSREWEEKYGRIFEYVIKSLIPEFEMKLAGTVCDFC